MSTLLQFSVQIHTSYFFVPSRTLIYIIFWSGSEHGIRGVLASTKDFKSVKRHGYICLPDNRNIVLFPEKINGKYVRLDRPSGIGQKGSIWLSSSPDLVHWGNSEPVLSKGSFWQWEGGKQGPGVPPIKTEHGWLIIYHALHGGYFGYYLGCALLDLDNPHKVIGKSRAPILAPREEYERNGAVPNVVFSCGAILEENGDDLKIYYAGADTVICLANASLNELVQLCLETKV
jgi:beta-1,2-mannobiose phosphorylase / 1,2-beta-oligomannan phosphorylase